MGVQKILAASASDFEAGYPGFEVWWATIELQCTGDAWMGPV